MIYSEDPDNNYISNFIENPIDLKRVHFCFLYASFLCFFTINHAMVEVAYNL